ncbi:glycosyltransferase [Clostridium sp. M62/1]|uniref:glycosyltransferase n=1 Tax=Clostridium sp. M62/1 TaxID=411486 RepID=UPI003566209D
MYTIRKKVLIVTALGGFIRSFLTNDIKILQKMGYEVHCAANNNHPGNEGLSDYFRDNNVIFHQVDFSSSKPFSMDTIHAYVQLKEILRHNSFVAIHSHTPIAAAVCRWAAKKYRRKGTNIIYTVHGFFFHRGSSKKSWIIYRSIEWFLARYTDAIITINKEDFKNAKNMHFKKVYYIPGVGVDTEKFKKCNINRDEYRKNIGIKKDDFLILAIGELSKRKNHKIILEAISKLSIPNIVFMICGNSMTEANTTDLLKSLAKQYNIDLRLMGLRQDIPQICKCADIGVMPSTREGLGLSGIEMLASGLPIVASNVHGILDYVKDGVNGYLANPYSCEEFAEGILKLYMTKIDKKICQKSVEKFDIKNSYDAMSRIYNQLLDGVNNGIL